MDETPPPGPKMKRRKWPWIIAAAAAIVAVPFLMLAFGPKTEILSRAPIGGKWWSMSERAMLREGIGGGPWPTLRRKTRFGTRVVEVDIRHPRYIGDDCVLYIAYYIGLRAACGDHPPITLSESPPESGFTAPRGGIDWKKSPADFSGDSIPISDATFISIAEVKRRAQASVK